MDTSLLHILLGVATLLPLISFFIILVTGPRLGKPTYGAYIATGAIVGAGVLSFCALAIWLTHHFPKTAHHGGHGEHHADEGHGEEHGEEHGSGEKHDGEKEHNGEPQGEQAEHDKESDQPEDTPDNDAAGNLRPNTRLASLTNSADDESENGEAATDEAQSIRGPPYTGEFYTLGIFGNLRLTISYYIDSLTIVMFCMVTLIASCIHFYAMGYMHEELHDVTDHEVTMADGSHLKRPGRYYRFFQYLSLFCFSMLGLVLAGNIAMVFIFWELVGVCSYFLIGFYVERKTASTAANKAFITNRVGDFGMIIGLMAIWAGMGTFAFGDIDYNDDKKIDVSEQGLFTQVRPAGPDDEFHVPAGMARAAAQDEIAAIVTELGPGATDEQLENAIAEKAETEAWSESTDDRPPFGYWLMIVAGIGIFCGCAGKSAQFPLHVWLPDAMEGPTPVSALVHSATMVAAGVYLVARFFPMFVPEVLLVIAIAGVITLFMAATIAITATDIKRVLAYSTISQLGYMMLALGLGGWVAGVMHLITHAFFKSLLFMCSGSVIHAVHTNEMTEMGGLRKKMPYTAYTMLVGCLAIAGVSIPFVIGFSGYYSKDLILEQAFVFMDQNTSFLGEMFFFAAAGGAAITAFYMFRLWFMTFAGKPRNQHRYDHAHESPKVMYVPLIILAVLATCVAWTPGEQFFSFLKKDNWVSLNGLIEQARPVQTHGSIQGAVTSLTWPDEHFAHEPEQFGTVVVPVTLLATGTALSGIALAAVMYLLRLLSADEVRRRFPRVYRFLLNKWWFDELYEFVFIKPTLVIGRFIAAFDRNWIDWIVDGSARVTKAFANFWDQFADRGIVDGFVNLFAGWVWSIAIWFRGIQTGKMRQYIMLIAVGILALFILITAFWTTSFAG